MPVLTLGQARNLLWQFASTGDSASATQAQQDYVSGVINQVVERFLTNQKAKGTVQNYIFPVLDNTVTLPANVQTILQAKRVNTDGTTGIPFEIFGRWVSTNSVGPINSGIGSFDCSGSIIRPRLFDMGDGFPGYRNLTGTFTIRVTTSLSEPGTSTILLRGLDQNGNQIFSGTNTEGISLTIPVSGSATTTQQFTALSYWVKSAPTNGDITLSAVDTTTGVVTPFAFIVPGNLVSCFRKYYAPDAKTDNTDTILCSCKNAFVMAVADNDPIVPGHIGAMKRGMQAYQAENMLDDDRADKMWAKAYDLLDQDREEFDGDSAIGPLQFIGDYAAGAIPSRPL